MEKEENLIKRALLFLTGFLLLNVINLFLSYLGIFYLINELLVNLGLGDSFYAIGNFIIYLIAIIVALIIFGIDNIKELLYRFKNTKHIKTGIIIGIIMVSFQLLYGNLISIFIEVGENENQAGINDMTLAAPIITLISLVIEAPLLEELTYRYGLFGFFKKFSKPVAYIVTIVIFTIIHINFSSNNNDMINELTSIPTYAFAALCMSYAYDKYGLEASMTAHAFNNLISFISIVLVSLI